MIQNFVLFNFYEVIKCKLRKNLLAVFLHALVWLIIVYCMKGCVTCYIKNVELLVYVVHQILQKSTCHCHSHVLNYISVQNLAQT